jgi:hypothetical protein
MLLFVAAVAAPAVFFRPKAWRLKPKKRLPRR